MEPNGSDEHRHLKSDVTDDSSSVLQAPTSNLFLFCLVAPYEWQKCEMCFVPVRNAFGCMSELNTSGLIVRMFIADSQKQGKTETGTT